MHLIAETFGVGGAAAKIFLKGNPELMDEIAMKVMKASPELAARLEFAPATWEGEACVQVVFRRREELDPELAREVEELRQRDPATGLLNRPTFLSQLDAAVAEAASQATAHGLLLVEPDHYAQLLEVIGLDASDALMAAMGRRLAELAPEAALGRFGEPPLALLARGNDYHATSDLAERVRGAFAGQMLEVGENSLNVTTSIGGV